LIARPTVVIERPVPSVNQIIMSHSDNITKSFDTVPKLVGKENFVIWRQRITLALSLTRTTSWVVPDAQIPHVFALPPIIDPATTATTDTFIPTTTSGISCAIFHQPVPGLDRVSENTQQLNSNTW